jgi:hypothetical protein
LDIDGYDVPLVQRRQKVGVQADRFATQVLVGLADEAIDLDETEFVQAINESPTDPKTADGRPALPARACVRTARPAERGLMLLYLLEDATEGTPTEFVPAIAISFPRSDTAKPLAYTVNEVWRQEYGLVEELADAQPA